MKNLSSKWENFHSYYTPKNYSKVRISRSKTLKRIKCSFSVQFLNFGFLFCVKADFHLIHMQRTRHESLYDNEINLITRKNIFDYFLENSKNSKNYPMITQWSELYFFFYLHFWSYSYKTALYYAQTYYLVWVYKKRLSLFR